MIVVEIARQNSFHMTIVQYHDMIQTIPPDTANHAFHKSSLPQTSLRGEHPFDTHALDVLLELSPVDTISVPQ